MYENILIATDGSDLARKGIDHGLSLAQALGCKATILMVTEPLRLVDIQAAASAGIQDLVVHYDRQIEEEMKERFAALEARTQTYTIPVELAHEVDEQPAEAIVSYAERAGCDLIVMASHGRRGIRRMLLGSQTSEVLVHTQIPVLVIR